MGESDGKGERGLAKRKINSTWREKIGREKEMAKEKCVCKRKMTKKIKRW